MNKTGNGIKQRHSIFFRTFGVIVLLVIIIISLFSAVSIRWQQRIILKSLEAQAGSLASSIMLVCGNAVFTDDYSFISDHNMELVRNNPDILYVIVARKDGFSLLHSGRGWEQRENAGSWWRIGDPDSPGGLIIQEEFTDRPAYHYSVPLKYSSAPWGQLYLGLSLEKYNSEIRTMHIIMLLLTFSCLALGIAVAYLYAKKLSIPIRLLQSDVLRVAEGDLSVRSAIRSGDEIETLAGAFNRMTEKLQESTVSKEFLNNIIGNMSECLLVFDAMGRIKMVNPAVLELLGYREEELQGYSLEMLFAEEKDNHPPAVSCPPSKGIHRLFPLGKARNTETRFRTKNGQEIPVLFSGKIMENSREYEDMVCVALNITDRKKAEEKLQRAYDELRETQLQLVQSAKLASIGELVAGVAHELNQPLMVVRTNARLICRRLAEKEIDREKLKQYAEPIQRNTKRMMNLIGHLRSFSRQSETEFSMISLNEIAENCLMMINEQLRIHNVRLVRNYYPQLPLVNGNANQLEQVLLNLLTNARDSVLEKSASGHSEAEGRIEILTCISETEPDSVEVRISDNGHGVPDDCVSKIFDPFFTTKDVGRGTGLGLSISYGIVREHKGSITLAENGAEGSVFRILLPVCDSGKSSDAVLHNERKR